MPSPLNVPITPPRVAFIDPRSGTVSREWYLFFLSLFQLSGGSSVSLDDLQKGPPTLTIDEINHAVNKAVENLTPAPGTSELQAELNTVRQELQTLPRSESLQLALDAVRQELQTQPRQELGTMAALQQANFPWMTFDTTAEGVPPDVGTVAWDGGTTLGVQATPSVLIRVGESEYVYAKASAAITKGQLCYHTGAVGASGVITVAPTPLALADPNQIVGVAAETLALNAFGLIQISGDLRGFNTTGSSVGETWADGDALYYNPAYVGSMTKVKPSAPNQKTYIGEVINAASAGSGSMHIRIVPGSVLGGTDSNVQFGTLANGDLIQYDSALQYWKNVAPSTISTGTATNLAGGTAGAVPYQTGPGATTFRSIGTAGQLFRVNAGATAPEWTSAAALTETDDTNVTLTLGGNPSTALLSAVSMTLGWTGQLAVSRGGTGVATTTANQVFAGPTSGGSAAPSFRALVAADIPTLPYQPTSAPATYTANFSVAATDVWIINNKSGSSCVVTLPTASANTGRVLRFQNYQNQTLVSASSNVVPLAGGAATTAILEAVAGANATLVSNGTNWIMTQYSSNNALQLE